MIKDKRKGKPPLQRKLATTTKKTKLTANQYQATPQQDMFMDYWTNPKHTATFGNAYESALKAGYSPKYAIKITAPTTTNQWITEYRKGLNLTPEHITKKLEDIALNENNNSKSPADTQLKGLELLMKIHNLGDSKQLQINNIQVTPILGGLTQANTEPQETPETVQNN